MVSYEYLSGYEIYNLTEMYWMVHAAWIENSLRNIESGSKSSHQQSFEVYAYEAIIITILAMQDLDFTSRSTAIQEDLKYFQSGTLFPVEEQDVSAIAFCFDYHVLTTFL